MQDQPRLQETLSLLNPAPPKKNLILFDFQVLKGKIIFALQKA